jgi:hypothetical protein
VQPVINPSAHKIKRTTNSPKHVRLLLSRPSRLLISTSASFRPHFLGRITNSGILPLNFPRCRQSFYFFWNTAINAAMFIMHGTDKIIEIGADGVSYIIHPCLFSIFSHQWSFSSAMTSFSNNHYTQSILKVHARNLCSPF